MVTMIDEHYDRDYALARAQLNGAIVAAFRRFGQAVDNTFQVLNRIEYQAPWVARTKRARFN